MVSTNNIIYPSDLSNLSTISLVSSGTAAILIGIYWATVRVAIAIAIKLEQRTELMRFTRCRDITLPNDLPVPSR